jgi:hypothetical protein
MQAPSDPLSAKHIGLRSSLLPCQGPMQAKMTAPIPSWEEGRPDTFSLSGQPAGVCCHGPRLCIHGSRAWCPGVSHACLSTLFSLSSAFWGPAQNRASASKCANEWMNISGPGKVFGSGFTAGECQDRELTSVSWSPCCDGEQVIAAWVMGKKAVIMGVATTPST